MSKLLSGQSEPDRPVPGSSAPGLAPGTAAIVPVHWSGRKREAADAQSVVVDHDERSDGEVRQDQRGDLVGSAAFLTSQQDH